MTESAGGRRVLQIGRGYAQRLGELSNGCQLQRLAGFAAVDTHNADAGLPGELSLQQRALGAPVAQGRE